MCTKWLSREQILLARLYSVVLLCKMKAIAVCDKRQWVLKDKTSRTIQFDLLSPTWFTSFFIWYHFVLIKWQIKRYWECCRQSAFLMRSQNSSWHQFGREQCADWHKPTIKRPYRHTLTNITCRRLFANEYCTQKCKGARVHIHPHSCTCLWEARICRRYIRQSLHICVLQLKPRAPAPTAAHVPLDWVWPRATLPSLPSWVIHALTSDSYTVL